MTGFKINFTEVQTSIAADVQTAINCKFRAIKS